MKKIIKILKWIWAVIEVIYGLTTVLFLIIVSYDNVINHNQPKNIEVLMIIIGMMFIYDKANKSKTKE